VGLAIHKQTGCRFVFGQWLVGCRWCKRQLLLTQERHQQGVQSGSVGSEGQAEVRKADSRP
jgi:hypothetical protein